MICCCSCCAVVAVACRSIYLRFLPEYDDNHSFRSFAMDSIDLLILGSYKFLRAVVFVMRFLISWIGVRFWLGVCTIEDYG